MELGGQTREDFFRTSPEVFQECPPKHTVPRPNIWNPTARSQTPPPPKKKLGEPNLWYLTRTYGTYPPPPKEKLTELSLWNLPPPPYMREKGTICPFGVLSPVLQYLLVKFGRFDDRKWNHLSFWRLCPQFSKRSVFGL